MGKNKKTTEIKTRLSKKTIITGITVSSLIGLVLPKIVNAQLGGAVKEILGSFAIDLISRFTSLIFSFLSLFVTAGAKFFEGALNIGFTSHIEVVEIGWGITRDFANMFFILFLVIVAFGTILRIEQYGIKQLLPKVIIIALLINFSFVIAGVVIDFTNIAAGFFVAGINQYTQTRTGGLGGVLLDSFSLPETQLPTDPERTYETSIEACANIEDDARRQLCETNAGFVRGMSRVLPGFARGYSAVGSWEEVLSLLITMLFGSVILVVAAFTLLAGAILLVIRIVVLWFLILIVPLAFLCYIMPALRRMWQKWWSVFLSWCLFAPIYAFFIWMAVRIAAAGSNRNIATIANVTPVESGPGANAFTTNPGQELISFIFIIAFLLGGLVVAKQMGIYGAKTVISIGQRMAGAERVKRYMKARKAVREEGKKEAVKRRLRLRETGGPRQAIRERMPGEMGRQARARRRAVITTEADRLTKTYSLNDIRRIAGYRLATGYRRTSRLAAARALTDNRLSTRKRGLSQAQRNEIAETLRRLRGTLARYRKEPRS